ncbi:hypothetical protein CONPUDRAFT_83337 [Coniophora puteana RWD-64-598 SS2]|uniref:F-box domain-containing protein n=1 Tax=Coniophora puteana (strain RWD-64-598) TaxID=741705 RepID=A0A5M3MJ61_CONPW|nr:uncharacterized protein CONPUDRAFT_83337 [Coniophora puteana RWD-64-598 SS2]EIW78960.1 hypothetical protein CONPUDRAFT_83337 [Coniophora puteana RWD-64-598 SS2]
MGHTLEKMTAYCPISGCTPDIPHGLASYLRKEFEGSAGPLVTQALEELILEDKGMNDVTIVGDLETFSHRMTDPTTSHQVTRNEVLHTPESNIRVVRHCKAGERWSLGIVDDPVDSGDDTGFIAVFGVLIMVQTFSLPILHLATNGRVTPQRLWRLAMHQGWSEVNLSESDRGVYGLVGVDYGALEHERKQYPSPLPWMIPAEAAALEELGDCEAIKEVMMHRGGLWMWMSPDRFPLEAAPEEMAPSHVSSVLSPPNANPATIEKLPFELLCAIVLEGPLSSLLSLASASRSLYALILGSESDKNAIASAWIIKNAPWYVPVDCSDEENTQSDLKRTSDTWTYLRRCQASASMRNRERIWRIAEQIEALAERCEV